MKFTSTLVVSTLASMATAQYGSTYSATPAQTSEAACLAKCEPTNNTCRAACVVGPASNPNDAAAIATHDCAANCKQGSGTAADNAAYGQCLQGCIHSYYVFPPAATAGAVGGAAPGTPGTPGAYSAGAAEPVASSMSSVSPTNSMGAVSPINSMSSKYTMNSMTSIYTMNSMTSVYTTAPVPSSPVASAVLVAPSSSASPSASSSASVSGSGSASTSTLGAGSASSSTSSSGTATGTAAASTSKAAAYRLGSSIVGAAGMVAAVLVL